MSNNDTSKNPARPSVTQMKRAFEQASDYHPNFFPVEMGLDAQKYHQKKPAEYAGVKFFSEQGWIHGVHGKAEPMENGGTKITIDHWVHRPDGNNILTRFMELEAIPATSNGKTVIRISKVTVQGEEISINDRRAINAAVSTCQEIMEQLRLERRMPLLNKIAEERGLKNKPLPDTYKDGNARMAYETGRKNITRLLRIPQQFLPAVTGFFDEGHDAVPGTPVLFNATTRGSGRGGAEYAMYGQFQKKPAGDGAAISLKLASRKYDTAEPYTECDVARFHFRPCVAQKNAGLVELASADIDGRKQRASNHKNAVRMMHFAHDAMLQVRHGMMPDLADIVSYTNTQKAISGLPPLTKEEGRRYTWRVLGGNPTGPRLFQQDGGIGANAFVHTYECFDKKGNYKSETGMVDCGITPLSRDATGFDGMMAHAGAFFENRNNLRHKPEYKADWLMPTHYHIDHYLGLPHLLLAGYIVPHVICNEATKMYIEADCKKLNVPPEWMPQKWTILDKEMDMKIGSFDLSFGWVPHSAITNWINVKTPEGSVLHFSDIKVDEHVMSHPPLNVERIKTLKPTMAVVDSTRAAQEDETKSEKTLEQEMVDFINENPGKAPVTIQIGSNAARMATVVNAYGRTGRSSIVLGAAIRFLKKVLDQVGLRNKFGIKAHAKNEYGVDVLNFSPKAKGANALIKGDPGKYGLFVTGTHNEPMSIINRLLENKDQKNLGFINPKTHVFIFSQTQIADNREWFKVVKWMERRGFSYKVIHASGHEGRKGIEKMLDWADAGSGVVTHGNPEQRAHAEGIVKSKGMETINPGEQDRIQVSDKKGCKIVAQEPSTMIYYSIKRPAEQHYGGGEDVEYYAHRVLPEIRSPMGKMVQEIAKANPDAAHDSLRMNRTLKMSSRKDPILNAGGIDLESRSRRVHISLPDYLTQNGIMRRIILDCETTQLGRYAWITEFAARQTDWFDDKKTSAINIRQTLPQTVLPDLDALLTTNITPSELYRDGEGYYPPRKFYNEIMKFMRQSKQLGDGATKTQKIWIDAGDHPKDPTHRTKRGAAPKHDPYMEHSLNYAIHPDKDFKLPRPVTVKTLVGGYNSSRSDDVWLQHAGFRAGALRYSPTNTGGMRRFDLRNMARIFAYLRPDSFKVFEKPGLKGFMDFTVEGIMKANNLGHEKYTAHEAGSDVEMADQGILKHMLSIDPELFTQCMLNADPKEVKKFLAGSHNGMLYPRHLLTYINQSALDARPNIGVYVGRSTDGKYRNRALIFNVSDFDPKDFAGMGPQELSEIMSNPKNPLHKAFEIIQLNSHPLLASADRGFSVGAARGTSIEAMRGYKHFIERNPKTAANMIKAMESARIIPDHDPRAPMEERIFSAPFMELSSHDRELAKLFEPVDDEFIDENFAADLNLKRAFALDQLHSVAARERYVSVLFQAEREFQSLYKKPGEFLHPDDRARERAKEKARVHGLIDSDAMSLGRLENQIRRARENWDKRMETKTPGQRKKAECILSECQKLVDSINVRINARDPEWTLSEKDYALLGLNDNINYGRYRPPLAENPHIPPKLS